MIGMSGVADPIPVTTSSSQAVQSLKNLEDPLVAYGLSIHRPPACAACFALRPLICIPRLKERRTGLWGLFGIQHLEDDSREVSRVAWSDHHSEREQGSPKLISVNTLLHPPWKISPSSLLVFSHYSQHTAGQATLHTLCACFLTKSAGVFLCPHRMGAQAKGGSSVWAAADELQCPLSPRAWAGRKTAETGPHPGGLLSPPLLFLTTQAGSLSLSFPLAGISASGLQQPGVTALLCVSSLPRIPNPFSAF